MENDLELESGPYIVLSDGSTFDIAFDCEVSYMNRIAENEIINVQNRGRNTDTGPMGHFDAADTGDVYSIPLRDVLRFYFEHHKEPMQ